jgi:hypothetical protein
MLQFKHLACKCLGQKLSIHRAIICSYGSKSHCNLVLNKSKPKYRNKSKQSRAKNPNKSLAGLEYFQAKSAKGASISSIWLEKSRPKAFHSPCDNFSYG